MPLSLGFLYAQAGKNMKHKTVAKQLLLDKSCHNCEYRIVSKSRGQSFCELRDLFQDNLDLPEDFVCPDWERKGE